MANEIEKAVEREWAELLQSYPPALSLKKVSQASCGIIKTGDVYKRNSPDGKRLEQDVRQIGVRAFVTRDSLVAALTGCKKMAI